MYMSTFFNRQCCGQDDFTCLNIDDTFVKMVSIVCSSKTFLQGPQHWINIGEGCGPVSSLNFNKIYASDTLLLFTIVFPN